MFQPHHKLMPKDYKHDKITAAYLGPLTEQGIEKKKSKEKKEVDFKSHITYFKKHFPN